MIRDWYLANDGVVGPDLGVAPWEELEIDDGDKAVLEELGKIIDHEVGAVRA